MKYEDILGTNLKSDFLLDLFETYDVDVVYNYDRTHENIDDQYYAEIPTMGLEFHFDKSETLTTLFMKKVQHTGHNPFDGEDPRNAPFTTGKKAVEYAQQNSIEVKYQKAKKDSFFGKIPEWAKLSFDNYSAHYQFKGNAIDMVTLQLNVD